MGLEAIGRAAVARIPMEHDVALERKACVDGLNVRQDGRVFRSAVPEVKCPLDRGEILVFDSYATDFEGSGGIGEMQCPRDPLLIELARSALKRPFGQKLGGGTAAIGERKERLGVL